MTQSSGKQREDDYMKLNYIMVNWGRYRPGLLNDSLLGGEVQHCQQVKITAGQVGQSIFYNNL